MTDTTQAAGLTDEPFAYVQHVPRYPARLFFAADVEPKPDSDSWADDVKWTKLYTEKQVRAALAAQSAPTARLLASRADEELKRAEHYKERALKAEAALAAQAVPAIDVEKHMCGYARLGSDGVYKLVGMRRNPIMDDGELHLILAFTDDQIEAFASPAPAEAKEEPKQVADLEKIQRDVLGDVRLTLFGKITEANLQHNSFDLIPDAAWEVIREAVKRAINLTAREVADPVWPYAKDATPQPQAAQPVGAIVDFNAPEHGPSDECVPIVEWAESIYGFPTGTKLYTAAPALTEEQIDAAVTEFDEWAAGGNQQTRECIAAVVRAALRSTKGDAP